MTLGMQEFSDIICEKLEEIGEEVVLINPSAESKFPCREMNTPLKNSMRLSAKDTFQISIKHWNESQRMAMHMADVTDEKLLELNLIRTNTSLCLYDEILHKYGLTTTYEVRYNQITNSFEMIR